MGQAKKRGTYEERKALAIHLKKLKQLKSRLKQKQNRKVSQIGMVMAAVAMMGAHGIPLPDKKIII